MENKEIYFKPKVITLAQQASMIEITYPNLNFEITSNGKLIISGIIKPTALSRKYTIKISYIIGNFPIVEIINPKLEECSEKLPHVYKDNNLCLFYPRNKEWTKYDYIADKIIPWTSLWLYYYEVWKVTGEWEGGGKHPQLNNKGKREKRYLS